MIQDVIDGIVAALVAEFPGVPVHDEPVMQGIVEPSFSVRCVKPSQRLFRGERYYQEDLYEVVYFPPVDDRYKSSNATVEKLFNCLEYIELPDGKIMGRDMNAHTDEDFTVVFTVLYGDFLYKQEEKVLMDSLTQTHATKGDSSSAVWLWDESGNAQTEERKTLLLDSTSEG